MVNDVQQPLWKSSSMAEPIKFHGTRKVDTVVIGGGMTGLTAAYLLKQAGKNVVLLERDRIASGDSGRTTAHLTCVTDVRFHELANTLGRDEAALAWRAGAIAIDFIEHTVNSLKIDCHFRRVPGYLHAPLFSDKDDEKALKEDVMLAREQGFAVQPETNVPLVNKPGMRIDNQAIFHPLPYLDALVAYLNADDPCVFELSNVDAIEESPLVVKVNGGEIECDQIFVATHVPIQGKADSISATVFQSRLSQYTSYVVSATVTNSDLPEACFWDTNDPYYYLRCESDNGSQRVIFGGLDHKTGQADNEAAVFRRLEADLLRILPSAKIDHRWSGQIISTPDGLPYIGETAPGQFAATGFNGNGMTYGTIAALMARDWALGQEAPWRELFSTSRTHLRAGLWEYIKNNFDYPFYLAADRLAPRPKSFSDIAAGDGEVLSIQGQPIACCRDSEGSLHSVSAVCTHMGCYVRWNTAERTWDCPCHGSRFDIHGNVISGPAEAPLTAMKSLDLLEHGTR